MSWAVHQLPWPGGAPCAVTLTFDGGYESAVTAVRERPSLAQLPTTWFLVTSCVGDRLEGRSVSDWAVWREWAAQGCIEVGNHSHTHPLLTRPIREIPRALLPRERYWAARRRWLSRREGYGDVNRWRTVRRVCKDVLTAQDVLHEQMGVVCSSFAYPNGRERRSIASVLATAGMTSARTTEPGVNGESVDLAAVRSEVWTRATTEEGASGWVDAAVSAGGWLVETLHLLEESSSYQWSVDPQLFSHHVEVIRRSGAWIATQRDVARHIEERRARRFEVETHADSEIELLTAPVSAAPVDVEVVVPPALLSTWGSGAVQAGSSAAARVVNGRFALTVPAGQGSTRITRC